jgi:hypothetical protein
MCAAGGAATANLRLVGGSTPTCSNLLPYPLPLSMANERGRYAKHKRIGCHNLGLPVSMK